MALTDYRALRRKDDVSNDVRTPGKDEAAAYIEENVIEKDRWPMPITDIADECGWSPQHIRNTLEDYFQPVDESGGNGKKSNRSNNRLTSEIEIPGDVDNEADYLRGWVDCLKRG